MRTSKALILPALALASFSSAWIENTCAIRMSGKFVGIASQVQVGRITFKAKEGATIARAFDDTKIFYSPAKPTGFGDLTDFVSAAVGDPFASSGSDMKIGMPPKNGPQPAVSIVTSMLTRLELPEMDVDAIDPALIRFDMNTLDRQRFVDETPLSAVEKQALKEQKKWLPANFRLRLGDLPCSRVNKIDAIVVKQGLSPHGHTAREVGDFSFYLPLSASDPFRLLFIEGSLGKPTWLPLQIVYMDRDSAMFSFDVTATIVGVDFEDQLTDPYRKDGSIAVTLKIDQQKLDSILNLIR